MNLDPFDDGTEYYGPAEKKKAPLIKIPLHKVWDMFKRWQKKKETVRRRKYER